MGVDAVKDICIIKKKSSRTGNDYSNLVLEFKSGYTLRLFLNDEQVFACQSSGLEVRN